MVGVFCAILLGTFVNISGIGFSLADLELQGREIVSRPADWRSRAEVRVEFAREWCGRNELSAQLCRLLTKEHAPPTREMAASRGRYCRETEPKVEDCRALFRELNRRLQRDFRDWRDIQLSSLRPRALGRRDLRGADLRESFLAGLDFGSADLEGARLSGAVLEGADFGSATLDGADLSGADLPDARLSGLSAENADFSGADLTGANLAGARLAGAHFEGATLHGADLRGVDITALDFRSADLSGADFGYARLEGADLSRVDWAGASLAGADLENANLQRGRFFGAYLGKATLSGADLSFADLDQARLNDVRLYGATLIAVRLTGADLRKSRWDDKVTTGGLLLRGADLRGALRLSQAHLRHAVGDETTLLPDAPDEETGEPLYVWSCWADDWPVVAWGDFQNNSRSDFERARDEAEMAAIRCAPDERPRRTGRPMALEAESKS